MDDPHERRQFIPGLQLSECFFNEQVRPILGRHWPGLPYSAALIGPGSEVLGFDDEMSSDHHWGPRVMVFLAEEDFAGKRQAIHEVLSSELPGWCRGYPTHFTPPDPQDHGTQLLQPTSAGPINHRVELYTLHSFFAGYLAIDVEREIEPVDWLTLPQQKLASITAGGVFHDDLGLQAIRARLSFYPHDVWLYLLACGWARIGQEEHLMGRCGMAGDELGSALVAARLVRDVMRLAFLMERQYAPYAKWLGTAFARLACAPQLKPALEAALQAQSWQEREAHLCAAYEALAGLHNALAISEALPTNVSQFWGRPFRVIQAERFVQAIQARITQPQVKALSSRLIGSIDLMSDNTNLLEEVRVRPVLRDLWPRALP